MSVISFRRSFASSTAALVSAAQRLLAALEDQTIGAPVVFSLSPAFVADFTAQLALVVQLGAEQSGAIGSVGTLVRSQAAVLAEFRHQASVVRRAARLAFPGQSTLLHGEFQIGASGPRDFPGVLERGRKLLAACQRYALDLAPHGWPLTSTEALEKTLEGLADVNREREQAADAKLGLSAGRIVAANRLHRQCRTAQNVARLVYAGARASADPASVEARARFLLGEFPRRSAVPVKPLPVVPFATIPMPVAIAG